MASSRKADVKLHKMVPKSHNSRFNGDFLSFAPDFSDRVVERGQAPSLAGQRRQSRQILLLGNTLHPITIRGRGTAEHYCSIKARAVLVKAWGIDLYNTGAEINYSIALDAHSNPQLLLIFCKKESGLFFGHFYG